MTLTGHAVGPHHSADIELLATLPANLAAVPDAEASPKHSSVRPCNVDKLGSQNDLSGHYLSETAAPRSRSGGRVRLLVDPDRGLRELCPRIGCGVPLFLKDNARKDRSDYPACRRYKGGYCSAWDWPPHQVQRQDSLVMLPAVRRRRCGVGLPHAR